MTSSKLVPLGDKHVFLAEGELPDPAVFNARFGAVLWDALASLENVKARSEDVIFFSSSDCEQSSLLSGITSCEGRKILAGLLLGSIDIILKLRNARLRKDMNELSNLCNYHQTRNIFDPFANP